jgi:hypothetical protein
MACKYVDGKYIFHQTCGLWNAPCIHGCGYLHLSLVVHSAGIAPLAGGSGIGISASDTRIPKISVGKPSEKRLWFPVKKSESEFPISEFRYIIYVGLSMITQRQETTRHKMFPPA